MALKLMLQQVLPGLRCFFAVDDLEDISQLDDIQRNRIRSMLESALGFHLSAGARGHGVDIPGHLSQLRSINE